MSYTGRCYCGDLKYEFDETQYTLNFYVTAENVGIYPEGKPTPLS